MPIVFVHNQINDYNLTSPVQWTVSAPVYPLVQGCDQTTLFRALHLQSVSVVFDCFQSLMWKMTASPKSSEHAIQKTWSETVSSWKISLCMSASFAYIVTVFSVSLSLSVLPASLLCLCPSHWSPWYNRTGWLGVKYQLTYLLPLTSPSCALEIVIFACFRWSFVETESTAIFLGV